MVTDEEVAAGKLDDGTPIKTGGRKGPFYVLVQSDKQDGTDIKATHTEVYELSYEEDGEGENKTGHYDLRQYEGMSGYNQSSNVYSKRGTEGNAGAGFKFGNWTRQTPERLDLLKSYGATSADELINNLVPKPDLIDLIKANPSVFDQDGKVKPNAKWERLDLPKGTRLRSATGTMVPDPTTTTAPTPTTAPSAPVAGLNPQQEQLVRLGIPAEVVLQGDEAIRKFAEENNIQLPPPGQQQ